MGLGDLLKKNVGKGSSETYFPTVAGAAREGASQVFGALKSVSFMLMILGFIHYLLRLGGLMTGLLPVFSLFLCVLAGYALSIKLGKRKGAVYLPMLFFFLWYIIFQANADPQFLIYLAGIFVAISAIGGLFTRGESVKPELYGLLPVLFLFLDVGLLPYLNKILPELGLQASLVTESLILFMPWWSLFGLFTLPTEDSSGKANFFITLARIVGILYILFVLITPTVPDWGYTRALPTLEEFEKVQAEYREKLPQKENPFWSNMVCIFGDVQNVQGCVEQRQEDSELRYICEKIEKKEPGTPAFNKCFEEQREKKDDPSLQVSGVVDKTIKVPTTAEILVDQKLFPTEYFEGAAFPFQLKIKNPRKTAMSLALSCNFTSSQEGKSVQGKIDNGQITFKEGEVEQNYEASFLCIPEGSLNGSYTLFFNAQLQGLKGTARLQRAFIGDVTPEKKEKLRQEQISKVIQVGQSQAPADLAVITFDVGHALGEPIIEHKEHKPILVRAKVENKGSGRIVSGGMYAIALEGFTPSNPVCLSGTFFVIDATKKEIPLPACVITDYPEELKDPLSVKGLEWINKEFQASITYNYLLSKEVKIIITPPVRIG